MEGGDHFAVDLIEIPTKPYQPATPRAPGSIRRKSSPRASADDNSQESDDSFIEQNYPYPLEREANYTPLYKKYFYKKGTT